MKVPPCLSQGLPSVLLCMLVTQASAATEYHTDLSGVRIEHSAADCPAEFLGPFDTELDYPSTCFIPSNKEMRPYASGSFSSMLSFSKALEDNPISALYLMLGSGVSPSPGSKEALDAVQPDTTAFQAKALLSSDVAVKLARRIINGELDEYFAQTYTADFCSELGFPAAFASTPGNEVLVAAFVNRDIYLSRTGGYTGCLLGWLLSSHEQAKSLVEPREVERVLKRIHWSLDPENVEFLCSQDAQTAFPEYARFLCSDRFEPVDDEEALEKRRLLRAIQLSKLEDSKMLADESAEAPLESVSPKTDAKDSIPTEKTNVAGFNGLVIAVLLLAQLC